MKVIIAIMFLLISTSHACPARLIDKGGGLIYDSVWNITWLQDANLAMTTNYIGALNGLMRGDTAQVWAKNLKYAGYDDWRLPNVLTLEGKNCSGDCHDSEMLHLFFSEGVSLLSPSPFINLQRYYWSGTDYAIDPFMAYSYDPHPGWGITIKSTYLYGMAVRDGDSSPIDAPLVRLTKPILAYFVSISSAYRNMTTAGNMDIRGIEFTEDISFDNDEVVLIGGYNQDFSARNTKTTIHGSVTINKGVVVMDNITIR